MYLADRRSRGHDRRPQAERFKCPLTAARQRGRAVIETGLLFRRARNRFNDSNPQAQRRERQGQADADHAAAGNDNVVVLACVHADAISFSISSADVGKTLLSTSGPPRVTATSSSIRTPMLRQRFSTAADR